MNLLMVSGDVRAAAGVKGEFYELLRQFVNRWDRIDVVCPRLAEAEPRILFEKAHLHPVGRWAYPDVKAKLSQPVYTAAKLKELLRERTYGLMTVHQVPPFHTAWAALRLAGRRGLPTVSEIHHVEGYPAAPEWPSRLRRIATTAWIGCLKNRTTAIRAVNAVETPGWLRAHGVPELMIKVIYSFDIDLDVFKPTPEVDRDIDFLFIGRMTPNKGPEIFLQALAGLKATRPDFRAVMVGQGPLVERIEAEIQDKGLAKNVELIRWVEDRSGLAELYRRTKALTVCSWAEGGPNVALEAMACGAAVLGPPIGVLLEVLRDGVNGYTIARSPGHLAGVMARIIDQPELTARMGRAGIETAARFESRKIIAAYADGLKRVAEEANA